MSNPVLAEPRGSGGSRSRSTRSIEGDGYSGRTAVEWNLTAREDAPTHVVVEEYGWTGDEQGEYLAESTHGFTWTIAGLKAPIEHGVRLNLVADRNPDAHEAGWQQV